MCQELKGYGEAIKLYMKAFNFLLESPYDRYVKAANKKYAYKLKD